MAYENIKLKYSNFTIKDGYFFTFSHDNDLLLKKNSSGDVVFTYPLLTPLDASEVLDVCCDSINFWTLQAGSSDNERVVKKWRIERNTCNLIDMYIFGDIAHYYSSEALVIENFSSVLLEDLPYGSTSIFLPESFEFDIPTGSVLTIGPNSSGFYEEVTVTGTISQNNFGLDFFTSLSHEAGESVSFVSNIWLFNNYNGITDSSVLICYNLVAKDLVSLFEDASFLDITGSTFYINTEGDKYIVYVYETSIRFFNLALGQVTKTMTIDNLKADGSTVVPIYGLEVEGDTVYRLQNHMTYFETNYQQTTYNYQCSTLRPFIDSVSMEVYPKILPSNGVSSTTVKTAMQDQYGEFISYKTAHLSDDDDYGYLTIEAPLTDLQGIATSYYRAGLTAREVTITSYATQYD